MPKINIIGMVVLCLAVASGAAVMALRAAPPPRVDAPRVDRLIRRLADTDPDLRREAEQELKELGRKAEPALKEAARGSDAVAQRAREILGIKAVEAPPPPPASGEVISDPAPAASEIRLSLQVASSPRRLDEPVLYYLRLHNGSKRSLAIARRLVDGRPDYRAFGGFERIDAEGRVVPLTEAVDEESPTLDIVVVAPGEAIDLVPGSGFLRMGASGVFRLRYVYDASEGSEYRARLTSKHHAGSILPAERFESNSIAITIP